MCCKLTIQPLDPGLARSLLAIGLFLPVYRPPTGGLPIIYRRAVDESGGVRIEVRDETDLLILHIEPPISSYDDHDGRRIQASIALELAAKYAEKVGGRIVQEANVGECIIDGERKRVLAEYPLTHLDYRYLCPGFQHVMGR